MAEPIGSFSGLASGVQWRDLVDQLMNIETQRKLGPVTTRSTLAQKQVEAWTSFQSLVVKFRDASKALRDGTAFSPFKVAGGTSVTSGRTLLTATASSGAVPGSYNVEVLDVARANKVSGNVIASASTALAVTGDFAVNGKKVTVAATDTLAMVRDKINALNSGATPTGVTATVLSTGGTQHRLVLTSDQTGAGGIDLLEGTGNVLQSLGVVDGTKTLNVAANGGVQTNRVSSTTAAIATMLGVTMPPPGTINIGGRVIAVDLTVDSLSSIAAKITAAGGNASVVSETQGGKTSSRLVTSDTVTAATVDGQRALEVLGFVENGRAGITQVVKSENTFGDGVGTATASTLLSALTVSGNPLGLVAGDTFAIQGWSGNGTAVSPPSFVIGAGDTVQTVLDKMNSAVTGFGAGSRPATASFVNGQFLLTDSVTGDSQLALSLSATRVADGSVVSLGRQLVDTVGRQREVVAGADAKLRVDGVLLTRPSNNVSDAMAGVTLNLLQAEVGSVVTLTFDRDSDTMTSNVKAIATAYNDLLKFRADQAKEGAPLRGNPTLRSSLASFTGQLLSTVSGVSGIYNRPGAVGLSLQSDGSLKLDEAVFKSALSSNYTDVVSLFTTTGTSANAQVSYFSSSIKTLPGTYAINVTAAATTPTHSGSGFSGTYVDDGTADTMSITDSISGVTGTISLTSGDSTDTIVGRLNSLFANSKMSLSASKVGNELVVTGSRYGTASTFTVAYTAGGTDGSAQLGFAAGTYAGTDIAGTIGGEIAIGSGQTLTSKPALVGQPMDGLSVNYSGTATGAVGDLVYSLGVSGMLFNVADLISAPDGSIVTQQGSLNKSITELKSRADTVQHALDNKRAALIRQFTAMETAISRIQSQAASLTSYLGALNSQSN
jgi:flagellar hook-associated protein 2